MSNRIITIEREYASGGREIGELVAKQLGIPFYNREILESRLAIYLREFQKEYPNELNVYYEDDDFICYCLEQNPNRLFNLGARES